MRSEIKKLSDVGLFKLERNFLYLIVTAIGGFIGKVSLFFHFVYLMNKLFVIVWNEFRKPQHFGRIYLWFYVGVKKFIVLSLLKVRRSHIVSRRRHIFGWCITQHSLAARSDLWSLLSVFIRTSGTFLLCLCFCVSSLYQAQFWCPIKEASQTSDQSLRNRKRDSGDTQDVHH